MTRIIRCHDCKRTHSEDVPCRHAGSSVEIRAAEIEAARAEGRLQGLREAVAVCQNTKKALIAMDAIQALIEKEGAR